MSINSATTLKIATACIANIIKAANGVVNSKNAAVKMRNLMQQETDGLSVGGG